MDPDKRKKESKIVMALLVIVGVIALIAAVICGRLVVMKFQEYKQSRSLYEDISGSVTTRLDPDDPAFGDAERSPIKIDFATLCRDNADVVGWLYCEGTVIDYPVAYSGDNDYYLHRLINGDYNFGGTIFLDAANMSDFSDRNNVLYGHNMNDGSMFASLIQYKRDPENYYAEHPVLYLNTPTGNYKLEVFSCFVTEAGGEAYRMAFSDDGDYLSWLDKMQANSKFETSVSLHSSSRVITLSTCSYEFTDARTVVMAKMVPIA